MERLYTDIDGNPLRNKEWNHHHPFYRWTAKGKGGLFRNFVDLMKVPMVVEPHNALHRETGAPLLPSASLIHRIKQVDLPDSPYSRLISVTEFLENVAENSQNSDHRQQSERIVENLHEQLLFILEGQVRVVEISNEYTAAHYTALARDAQGL